MTEDPDTLLKLVAWEPEIKPATDLAGEPEPENKTLEVKEIDESEF